MFIGYFVLCIKVLCVDLSLRGYDTVLYVQELKASDDMGTMVCVQE